jgi:hypothetical protein
MPRTLVMHCLPGPSRRRNIDDVLDGEHSIVFDQAENRLHAQKGILEAPDALIVVPGVAISCQVIELPAAPPMLE